MSSEILFLIRLNLILTLYCSDHVWFWTYIMCSTRYCCTLFLGLYLCQPRRSPEGWRIAFSPMLKDSWFISKGCFNLWSSIGLNPSDIYCVRHSSLLNLDSSIIINICYEMGPWKRRFIFIFCTFFNKY